MSEEEYPGSGTPWPDTNFIENLSENMVLSPKDNFYLWVYYEWLLKLEIPDHCLMWTFLVCPVARLITAGIGILI